MRILGRPSAPIDWEARTDGTARYAGDLRLPGMLVGAVLRSPHPHARIRHIDTSRAAAMPGVEAVLTAADLPDRKYSDYGESYSDRYPLARDVVRHVGEPVAIVAAQTAAQAAAAVAAITVRYQVRPAALTIAQALGRRAPRIHATTPGNVVAEVSNEFGDLAAGRARADHVVSRHYVSPHHTHAIMEPHTVVAHWVAEQGKLEMWAPSQAPRALHHDLATVFGLDPSQVHLNEVAIGGDFGSRVDISHQEGLAAALSIRTGKPVMISHDRADEMAFSKSRVHWEMDLEMGASASGDVTYLTADYVADNGAYNMAGPSEVTYGSVALGSVYRTLGYGVRGRCVYTNKQPSSSFRGAGAFAPLFGLEVLADELADEVGLDPIDFRSRNAVRATGEAAVTGWTVKSSGLLECLSTVRREIDWDNKRRQGGSGRGVGVAAVIHVTGLRREGMVESGAAVDILPNGRVRLRSGCGDPGTGQKTMLAKVVAEELGLGLDRIDVVTTDTERTPHDTGAGASRGTFISGHAVGKAARTAAEALRGLAAEKLGCAPDAVALVGGYAVAGDESLPMEDLISLSDHGIEGELRVETEYVGDFEDGGYGDHGDLSATYSFAAHAVEVDVDRETGAVRVVQVVAAHDSGRILNPLTARGQVEGGVVIGLGGVLGEELLYEGGRLVNAGYVDYHMPRAADAPPIHVFFVGEDDPVGPYGAKGLAEIALLPTGPATVNAVSHALGRRVRSVPLTPDKIIDAMSGDRPQPARAAIWRRPDRWWVALVRWGYPRGIHRILHRYGSRWARPPRGGEIRTMVSPRDVDAVIETLACTPDAALLAGGTDLLVARRQALVAPSVLVDLTSCRGLGEIVSDDTGLTIGAAVTLSQLHDHPGVPDVLRATVAQIALPQIRNVATVAGNLVQEKRCWFYRNGFDCYKRSGSTSPCYAVLGDHRFSHAVIDGHRCQAVTPSDLATTLYALDAIIRTKSCEGVRELSVADFYVGPGETVLAHDEVVVELVVPAGSLRRTTAFRKLRLSEGGFAVVSAAASVRVDARGRIDDCRVVLGGVAPTPFRAVRVEKALIGAAPDDDLLARASRLWTSDAHPLERNAWKLESGSGLLRQTLADATRMED